MARACVARREDRCRRSVLESFSQLFRERALRSVVLIGPFVFFATALTAAFMVYGAHRRRTRSDALLLARFGRLSLIGPQETFFKRRTVEPADDGVHLLRIRRRDKRETLRFLGLGVADDFDVIEDEVFRVEPRLDIVLGNPGGQIAEENSKTHSFLVFLAPFVDGGDSFADAIHESYLIIA